MTHANSSSRISGFPLCRSKEGTTTKRDADVDCEKCLAIMVPHALKAGYKMEPNMIAYQKKHNIE